MNIHDLFVPSEDELQLLPSPRVPEPPLIEWKAAFGDLFFRIKGSEPNVLWCVLRCEPVVKRLSRAWSGCRYFRVVPFEDGDDWALLRPRFVLVKSPQQTHGAFWKWEARFSEKIAHRKWLQTPQEQLCAQLQAANADLSLRMARDCAALPPEKRFPDADTPPELLATYQRWEQLVRAALVISRADSHLPAKLLLLHPHSVEGPLDFECVDSQLQLIRCHFWSPLPRAGKALLRIAQRHINLPFWRGLTGRGMRPRCLAMRFSLDSVSHHERLEAALLWRDFAHEIGKTDEIEPLLRELMNEM